MTFTRQLLRLAPLALAVVAGCATIPGGPSMMALPGTGKTFDHFRADDMDCRGYANAIIGGQDPNQAAVNAGLASAAIGTAVGAAAGAVLGGQRGAAVGAGTGLVFGSAVGTSTGSVSGYELQRRYDNGYRQCMYAKGHRVPVSGQFAYTPSAPRPAPAYITPPPPARTTIPPPPPGLPPPPPPR